MSIVGKTSNRYDDEFKAHAVSLVVDKGRPISAVAADLGVSQPALRRWVKLSTEPEDSVDKRIAELEAENKALKKDLSAAKDTVEVLKKSVAIFIKP
jgi:transposase